MAEITLGGKTTKTNGNLPKVGAQAPNFNLAKENLSNATLADYKGKKVLMNIFPSVDTQVCATSIREFNERAKKSADNVQVLCISRDLPFAQKRFGAAEGVENVEMLSDFSEGKFGQDYGLQITNGNFHHLNARAVVTLDEAGKVLYTQLVGEIGDQPDYDAALASFK
mgnify:CR=1 FL=1